MTWILAGYDVTPWTNTMCLRYYSWVWVKTHLDWRSRNCPCNSEEMIDSRCMMCDESDGLYTKISSKKTTVN